MPASAAFPHLDAVQALLDRATGARTAPPDTVVPFPLPMATAGSLLWPADHAHRVLHEWAGWTRGLPRDVTTAGRLVRLPALPLVPASLRGRAFVAIDVAIPREPWIADGRLAALRRLEPEIDTIGVVRADSLPALHAAVELPPPAVCRHLALDGLPGAAVDAFVATAGPASGSNLLIASLRRFGTAHGMAAAGLAADADEAAQLVDRLALLAGRLAPHAGHRGTGATPTAALALHG